jgi:hypothetical protein
MPDTTNYTYDLLDDLLTVASADTSQSSRNRSFTTIPSTSSSAAQLSKTSDSPW